MKDKNGISYEFGAFILDTKQNLLLHGSERVKLPAKTLELLHFFVRNPNQVIDKETLMLEVWKDLFVEEANLAVHISNLRKILNGDVNGKSAIETFPKAGYRFNADVRLIANLNVRAPKEDTRNEGVIAVATSSPNASSFVRSNRSKIALLLLAVLVLVGSGYVIRQWLGVQPFRTQTMTRVPGLEQSSLIAFSPNGDYVASSATKDGVYTLMMTHLGSGSSVQLLPADKNGYLGLTFSKDNSFLYFIKAVEERSLYRIPILGGHSTKILDGVDNRISFAPNGDRFCFVRNLSSNESAIVVASTDGSGEQNITNKKAPEIYSPYEITWSPDGKLIAIVAGSSRSSRSMQIVGVDVATGEEKPISDLKWAGVDGLEWLADGSGLVAGIFEAGSSPTQILFIPYPSGVPRKITSDINNYGAVSVSSDGKTIMAGQFEDQSRLWLGQDDTSEMPKPLITQRRHRFHWVRWTDDNRLLFGSDVLGSKDVWIMNADGSGERQLTEGQGNDVMPVASPDGSYIVFSSNRNGDGVFDLWRIDGSGENPKQLTFGTGGNQPSISPDSKWVFYTSGNIDGPRPERSVWKVPLDGGEAQQFVNEPAYGPDFSPDGKYISMWYKPNNETPWKVAIFSIGGGFPITLLDVPIGPPARWTADGKAVSYITTAEGVSNIWARPIDGSPSKPVTQFTSERINNFDWSRDGRLMCSRQFRTTDIVLIRNFQ